MHLRTLASCGLHGLASLSSPSLKKSEWPEAIWEMALEHTKNEVSMAVLW